MSVAAAVVFVLGVGRTVFATQSVRQSVKQGFLFKDHEVVAQQVMLEVAWARRDTKVVYVYVGGQWQEGT